VGRWRLRDIMDTTDYGWKNIIKNLIEMVSELVNVNFLSEISLG